jgi:hypothetical protein
MDGWLRMVSFPHSRQFFGLFFSAPLAHLSSSSSKLYRETEKRSGNRPKAEQEPLEQDSSGSKKGKPNAAQALSQGLDKHRERLLLGSLTNSHKFKVDGMIKKV